MRPFLLLCLVCVGCDAGGGGSDPEPDAAPVDVGLDALLPDAMPDAAPRPDLPRRGDMLVEPDGPPGLRKVWIGFNDLPEAQLGQERGTFEGRESTFEWVVPPVGWTIEVHVDHGPDWAPAEDPYVLWRGVSVVIDRHVVEDGIDPPGGEWIEVRGGHIWRGRVVEPLPGGLGSFSLQAAVDGNVSETTFVTLAERTPEADPFEEEDHWVVTWDRDLGALEVDGDTVASGEPNGVPDWEEAVFALGLLGGDEDWRAAVLAKVRAGVSVNLRGFFHSDAPEPDRVRIAFHQADDPETPPAEEWEELGWSRIAVGGDDPDWEPGERTFFGRANVDWNNTGPDDNTRPRRGIYTTSFVRFVMGTELTRVLISEYLPAGGQPFGSLPDDAVFVEPGFTPDQLPEGTRFRANRFFFVLDLLTLALSSVLAHEVGHSLGLVKPGFPPEGLLADVEGPWVERPVAGGHINTPGFNLMQSGSSFSLGDLSGDPPAFNAANLAYLRRLMLVTP